MKQLQDNRDYFRDMLDEDDSCKFTVVKPDIITKLLVERLEEDAIELCGYDNKHVIQIVGAKLSIPFNGSTDTLISNYNG